MLSVVVLISGSGSNLRALLEACDNPLYPARILAVGSENAAAGLAHAEEFGVPTFVVELDRFSSREGWAEMLQKNIDFFNPDLIVLAGFMKVLPAGFVKHFQGRMVNLHPSLLPEFPGAHAVRDALAAGATVTGTTIHLVDEGVDTGKILRQTQLAIPQGISELDLHEQIKELEREQLVKLVRDLAEGTLTLEGN
jgi:phosphoribosylglycinamide formyltransferase-1